MTTLVLMSDTHSFQQGMHVPEGDILIHAGDMTEFGRLDEVIDFNQWLSKLPHPHKIVIAGNHDLCFEYDSDQAKSMITNANYLQDQELEVMGINFFGSPWTPTFFDWAFMADPGPNIASIWAKIPENIDVLITHGPPFGICDLTEAGSHAGCKDLLDAVSLVKPKYHIFGHIHEGRGIKKAKGMTFVNASNIDARYQQRYPAFVLEI